MRSLLTLLLLTCFVTLTCAQSDEKKEKLDSLTQQLKKDSAYIYRPRLAKPYLRVENRYSFISKEPVNLVGFLAGATFREKHVICAGYYTLNRLKQESIELTDDNNVITREYLRLNYFVFSYQYVLFNKRYLQINTPLEIGYGLYTSETKDRHDKFLRRSEGQILPLSAGMQFIFKPIKWLGLSCVGGYRHAFQDKDIRLDFTGFYYSFGVWVDARHIIRYAKYRLKKKKYEQDVRLL